MRGFFNLNKMGTKSNPSCYHGALEYAALITGISKTKEIYITKAEYLRTNPNKNRNSSIKFKSKLKYPAANIRIETSCGKTVSYFPLLNTRYDAIYEFKRAIITVNRPLNDFGLEWEKVGEYKDSLGGGWHSMVAIYKHNDFYYADTECAH